MTTLLQKCLKLQGQEEEGEDGVKVNIDTLYTPHFSCVIPGAEKREEDERFKFGNATKMLRVTNHDM